MYISEFPLDYYNDTNDYQIWMETFYFMSNFLWNVIFVICNLIVVLPQNSGNRANAENDSPSEITHKIKSFKPNLMIWGS